MRLRQNISKIAAFAFLCAIAANANAACLTYTTRVRLEGTLERQTNPGPPMYESVAAGDAPETMWLIKLDRAQCVSDDPADRSGINAAVGSFTRVQLILTEAQYRAYAKQMGRHVVLTGKLFGAVTAHHHTPVLLDQVQFVP